MNPTQTEQLLLLEQSGELTATQRRALDAELAANPAARELRAQLRGLAAVLPPPAAGPAPDAAAQIAARLAQAKANAPAPLFRPAWKPALAAAAVLALLLGIQTYRAGHTPVSPESALVQIETAEDDEWTDPLEEEFAELESLMLAISDNPFDYLEL
jgi:anti-sigma factor RsiW